MTIEKLECVMERLRVGGKDKGVYTNCELRRAIRIEIGKYPDTFKNNKRALKLLGWIHVKDRGRTIYLTDNDLSGNY